MDTTDNTSATTEPPVQPANAALSMETNCLDEHDDGPLFIYARRETWAEWVKRLALIRLSDKFIFINIRDVESF